MMPPTGVANQITPFLQGIDQEDLTISSDCLSTTDYSCAIRSCVPKSKQELKFLPKKIQQRNLHELERELWKFSDRRCIVVLSLKRSRVQNQTMSQAAGVPI
jgi:hypothetical protein